MNRQQILDNLKIKKGNEIIIKQYVLKDNTDKVIIECHKKSNKEVWKYYGESIWEAVPEFDSLEDLYEYLKSK